MGPPEIGGSHPGPPTTMSLFKLELSWARQPMYSSSPQGLSANQETTISVSHGNPINEAKIEPIRDMLGYEGCFVVNNLRHSGGLAMLWKEKQLAVVTGHSRNHIDLEIVMVEMGKWRYYGFPEGSRRQEAWAMLQTLSTIYVNNAMGVYWGF